MGIAVDGSLLFLGPDGEESLLVTDKGFLGVCGLSTFIRAYATFKCFRLDKNMESFS